MTGYQKYQPHKVAYVDVDGTLIVNKQVNPVVVDAVKQLKQNGFEVILWSAQGKDHARRAAEHADIAELFDAILTKPDLVIDDMGWKWVKYVNTFHPSQLTIGRLVPVSPCRP